ncbi:MAG TPA: CoA transferase, partial [Bacillota bacterium]
LRPLIEDWLAQRPLRESVDLLLEHGVPASPVQTARDVAHCPHLEARRMFVDIDFPGLGRYRLMGNPIKISGHLETPGQAPPAVGDATVAVLRELGGYGDDEIRALLADGVISQAPTAGEAAGAGEAPAAGGEG